MKNTTITEKQEFVDLKTLLNSGFDWLDLLGNNFVHYNDKLHQDRCVKLINFFEQNNSELIAVYVDEIGREFMCEPSKLKMFVNKKIEYSLI